TNGDPRLCDCNRIIASEAIPVGPELPDKQKELSLKADWKYVGVVSYQFSNTATPVIMNTFSRTVAFIPEQFPQSIFHPPQS
ncbi:MAG: hypothetical protein JWQ30_1732, partial [Sediminibacterium sp.]|nr:hypothetical protein [Sediminibacterium sp.]